MQWYLCTLIAVLVTSTHGYSANKPYPTFAKCNQHTVSAIRAFWELRKPVNVLEKLEQQGQLSFYGTTYNYFNSENKCIYLNIKDNILHATFVPKNGGVPAKLTYRVEQGDDGLIRATPLVNDAPEYRFKWYPVIYRDGVILNYCCSDYEGSKELPLFTTMVATRHKSLLSSSVIAFAQQFLNQLGIHYKYNYGLECTNN